MYIKQGKKKGSTGQLSRGNVVSGMSSDSVDYVSISNANLQVKQATLIFQ